MDAKRVKIKYTPREPFRSFHKREQRWSVLVCHRRAGKTVATLNDLIRGAVNECKPEGRYAFKTPRAIELAAMMRIKNATTPLSAVVCRPLALFYADRLWRVL